MATAKKAATDEERDLQEEFDKLKTQVADLVQLLKEQGQQEASKIKGDLNEQFADYEEQIKAQISHLHEVGSESLDKVGHQVQKKPVTSLLVAFGVGYLLSKTLTHK